MNNSKYLVIESKHIIGRISELHKILDFHYHNIGLDTSKELEELKLYEKLEKNCTTLEEFNKLHS